MSGIRGASLTRPSTPQREYTSDAWQYRVGPALAVGGLALLMLFLLFSAVIAAWVSQLSDPAREAVRASRAARVDAWEAWLFPAAVAAIGLAKIGIATVLWGIVRRLWVRIESVKESLPALMQRGGAS